MNLLGDKPDPSGFQTDVRRKAALVTADPGQSRGVGGGGAEEAELSGLTSSEYLRTAEEEVNRAVDREVETLVEAMEEIVGLAAVSRTCWLVGQSARWLHATDRSAGRTRRGRCKRASPSRSGPRR